MSHDCNTIVVTDACLRPNDEIASTNVRDMKNMGITCVTLAELPSVLA